MIYEVAEKEKEKYNSEGEDMARNKSKKKDAHPAALGARRWI